MAVENYLDNNNELIQVSSPEGPQRAVLAASSNVLDYGKRNNIIVQVDTPVGPHAAVLIEDVGAGTTDNTTQDYIPIKDTGAFEDSPLKLNTTLDRVESSKTFYAPTLVSDPGTVILGNLQIDSGSHVLGVLNSATGQRALIVEQHYDETGSTPSLIYNLGAETNVDRQLLYDEPQPSVPYDFPTTFGPSENFLWTGLVIRPQEAGLFTFEIRSGSATGELLSTQEFEFLPGDIGNEKTLELSNGFLILAGETVTSILLGARLLGHTIGSTWVPYFKSIEHEVLSIDEIIVDRVFNTNLAGTQNVTPFNPTLDYHPATKKYVDDSIINPSRLCSYLPVAAPYTTPTVSAGSATKIYPATTIKANKDFAFDSPNSRYYLNDATASGKWFSLNASSSMKTNTSNHLVSLEVYKSGVFEEGLSVSRWIAAGADTGAIAVSGVLQLSHNDYIELYVITSKTGKITFSRLSINIIEIINAV